MTKENQFRLYKHFMEVGRIAEAEEILKAYPEFSKEAEKNEKDKKKE